MPEILAGHFGDSFSHSVYNLILVSLTPPPRAPAPAATMRRPIGDAWPTV